MPCLVAGNGIGPFASKLALIFKAKKMTSAGKGRNLYAIVRDYDFKDLQYIYTPPQQGANTKLSRNGHQLSLFSFKVLSIVLPNLVNKTCLSESQSTKPHNSHILCAEINIF